MSPNAPAFASSADPKGLVRLLRRQRDEYGRRRAECDPRSAVYASLSRKIAEASDAIERALSTD